MLILHQILAVVIVAAVLVLVHHPSPCPVVIVLGTVLTTVAATLQTASALLDLALLEHHSHAPHFLALQQQPLFLDQLHTQQSLF